MLPLLLLAAALSAQAQSTPAKKELVARIIKQQQPAIESMARNLAEQPAAEIMGRAGPALTARIPADKREAVAKDIQADVKKYVDEAVPLVQGRAVKLAPTTIGAILEDKFSEDELKQVVAIIESPVYSKFQGLGGDMQKALLEKLLADTRPSIEPKVKAMEQSVAKRLGVTAPAAAAPAAKPASK
ncbi:hypothetical protein [uncultured Ramlibacter sp.]|uniref:hypothetical protein n=1 Tax=uncultured Ramlibacter sp. TaxID=260755 RepID=UPI002636A8AA|nr:hypothetical protein [uncultured Ramlibacter sp.]